MCGERKKTGCPFSILRVRSDQGVQKCCRAVKNLFTTPLSLWIRYTKKIILYWLAWLACWLAWFACCLAGSHIIHTRFVHSFVVILHDYNFLITRLHVLWRRCPMCSCSPFFHCRSFSLYWRPLAFLFFSPPLQNFHVVLPTKFVSFVFLFLSLALQCSCLSLFFSLSFPGQLPTFSDFFSVFLFLYIPNLWTWQ